MIRTLPRLRALLLAVPFVLLCAAPAFADAGANAVTQTQAGAKVRTDLTAHATVVGNSTTGVTSVGPGTSGKPLVSAGSSTDPSFTTLGVSGGGTGLAAATAHYLLFGNGTSALTLLAPGSSGLPLVSSGASADPAYAALLSAGIASNAVTGAKIDSTSFLTPFAISGRNGAGAITLTGAIVGDKVLVAWKLDGSNPVALSASDLESTITVVDQIQQASASDLSSVQYFGFLLKKS